MYWLVVLVRLLLGLVLPGRGENRPRDKRDRVAMAARVDGRFVEWRLTGGPIDTWLKWWSLVRRWISAKDPDDTTRFDSSMGRRKRRT